MKLGLFYPLVFSLFFLLPTYVFSATTILGTTGANPAGITVDSAGNVYTANTGANNVTKITPAGVSTILGTTGTESFNPNNPTMVLLHGSIGSIADFKDYVPEFPDEEVNILIIDRPNYGNDYNPDYEYTILSEADLTNTLAQKYRSNNKNIILGYSFGGPIALLAHSKQPYDAVVLVAPAIDPENEFVSWFINFYRWSLTRSLVPQVWVNASREKLGHVADLERHVDVWSGIQGNIIHIHGDGDMLVPYVNMEFLKRKIPTEFYTPITCPRVGHGVLWSRSSEIIDILKEQLA